MDLLKLLTDARNATDADARAAKLAELLAQHSDADLIGLEDAAISATEAIGAIPADQSTDDDTVALETLVDVIGAVRERQTIVAEARADRQRRVDEALSRAARPAPPAAEASDACDAGTPTDAADAADTAATAEAAGSDAGAPDARVPLAAAARAPLGALRSDRPIRNGGNRRFTVEAAAEIPGVAAGGDLGDIKGLSRALNNRAKGLERAGKNRVVEVGLATIRRHPDETFAVNANGEFDEVSLERLDAMFDEKNLPGGSLVASGGWCAPSSVIYDLCPTATREGILDYPSVTVTRGGLRWPVTPDFSAVYSNTGFVQTETQAAAGTTKPCFNVPCPSFSEERMDAIGLCLTAGILTNQAYPELIDYWTQQALIAHDHRVNAEKLKRMTAIATAVHFTGGTPVSGVTPYAYGPGAIASILDALEIQLFDLRYKYRFGIDQSFEVVAPAWAEGLIRSDVSKRTGVDYLNVTDDMIMSWFRVRNLALQYVYDWQDSLTAATPGTGFGGTSPIMTYPATVGFLLYPAGAFIMGNADVIDLSMIYDSTNITTNTFTRVFSEEGLLVGQRCFESRYVTVDCCPNGLTGGYLAPPATVSLACPAA